jgi:hypothetical protein
MDSQRLTMPAWSRCGLVAATIAVMGDPIDAAATRARHEPASDIVAGTPDANVRLADGRLSVAIAGRVRLDVAVGDVRRIQFDIERDRPATLAIVPEDPRDPPQVLPIPAEQFFAVGDLLARIAARLLRNGRSP